MQRRLVLLGHYPPPVVLEPGQSLVEAMIALDQRGVRHGLVVDEDGRLQGILSIRRILSVVRRGYEEGRVYERLEALHVGDVMLRNPPRVVVGEFGVEDVVYMMSKLNVGAVAVVDADTRLLGVISEKHIAGLLALAELSVAVHEVMTKPVHTVGEDARLIDAIRVMDEHRHRHVPIVDPNGRLRAMVTARDALSHLAREESLEKLRSGSREPLEDPVLEVGVGEPASIEPEADLSKALRLMRRRGISALPVVDEEGRVVGLLSERDMVTRLPRLVGVEMFYDAARARLYVARVVS